MKKILFLSLAIFLTGCISPLQKYIKKHKYEPFEIPRTNWGVGTIVSYENGSEDIVAQNHECLNLKIDKKNDQTKAALPSTNYEVEKDFGLEASLPKVISPQVDLSGAFNDKRIEKVKIDITDPEEITKSNISIISKVKELNEQGNTACVEALLKNGNYVIDRVLILGKTDYSFEQDNNTKISLDLDLMKSINLSPEYTNKYKGKETMEIDFPIMVGYRLYKVEALAGLAGLDEINVRRISKNELKKIKKNNQ